MNWLLIILSSVCTSLNGLFFLYFQEWSKYFSFFDALPAAHFSLLFISACFFFLVPHFLFLTYFLSSCHSCSFSHFPPLPTHSFSLFSVPILLCGVCMCVIFSSFFPISPSYSCAFHRSKTE